jgi:hypothetical protein
MKSPQFDKRPESFTSFALEANSLTSHSLTCFAGSFTDGGRILRLAGDFYSDGCRAAEVIQRRALTSHLIVLC